MIPELSVGDSLDSLEVTPSHEQLFRYSAITWNTHRIHYDPEYAAEEGHPDVLVQAHMHGALIQRLLMNWAGPEGVLESISWRNIDRAVPDEELTVEAKVTSLDVPVVEFEVWTAADSGRCAEGKATVSFE